MNQKNQAGKNPVIKFLEWLWDFEGIVHNDNSLPVNHTETFPEMIRNYIRVLIIFGTIISFGYLLTQ